MEVVIYVEPLLARGYCRRANGIFDSLLLIVDC